MTLEELKATARAMRRRSYCPYSHFAVGAALECADGTVYTGCNVENGAYGSSICAERTAVVKAVSEGKRTFRRIAIAGTSAAPCVPCGECRQVLSEFAPELEVICLGEDGSELTLPLRDLLPHSFGLEGKIAPVT